DPPVRRRTTMNDWWSSSLRSWRWPGRAILGGLHRPMMRLGEAEHDIGELLPGGRIETGEGGRQACVDRRTGVGGVIARRGSGRGCTASTIVEHLGGTRSKTRRGLIEEIENAGLDTRRRVMKALRHLEILLDQVLEQRMIELHRRRAGERFFIRHLQGRDKQ